jgi:Fe-S-cluster containining protein
MDKIADNRQWVLDKLKHEPVIACGGCTRCCWNKAVFLYPDAGDNPLLYQTVEAYNPYWGGPGFRLDHKADGSCVYLTEAGCGIHANRPAACRAYSCVEQVEMWSRAEIRRLKRDKKWRPEDDEGERRLKLQRTSAPLPDQS